MWHKFPSKPRIVSCASGKKFGRHDEWNCSLGGVQAWGLTPKQAYENFVKKLNDETREVMPHSLEMLKVKNPSVYDWLTKPFH